MGLINNLPEKIQKKWQTMGFQEPSLIQAQVYDSINEGENVIGISPTGSGKTLAYLLPLLSKVKKGEGNQVLILLPSQELAAQVAAVAKEWAKEWELSVQSLLGGANISRQILKLKKKPEILVGTPGRVVELILKKKIKMHQLMCIVLDETDHLLQETNEYNLSKKIIQSAQKSTQLLCFSATLPSAETLISQVFQTKPIQIDVTNEDQSQGEIEHLYLDVSDRKRISLLKQLSFVTDMQAVIFFNRLADLGDAEAKLLYEGVSVASLASDQSKISRKGALEKFKEGKVHYLLTTDLGARGLDFQSLPYVIQFEPPLTTEGYIHRGGRTGRMGSAGKIITFTNAYTIKDLKKVTKSINLSLEELFLYQGKLQKTAPTKESFSKRKSSNTQKNKKKKSYQNKEKK